VSSTGASGLTVGSEGSVSFTADDSGYADVLEEFDNGGSLDSTTLYSGATTPGERITVSPEATTKPKETTKKPEEKGIVEAGVLSAKVGQAAVASGSVALDSATVAVLSKQEALIKLTCTGTATCSGEVKLTVKVVTKKGKKEHAKTEIVGTAVFSIGAGRSETVRLKLGAAGRALLSEAHGHLGATLEIVKSSPSPSKTQMRVVRLVEQKASKSKR